MSRPRFRPRSHAPSRSSALAPARSRRGLLVSAVAALVLAACASGPSGPLATVDGEEIPREQLEGWIRTATEANGELDAVGIQAELLSFTIQTRIFSSAIEARGLSVDPGLVEEIRAGITEQVGGELSLAATLANIGFPPDFFEDVFLRQQAILDTLAIELSAGRTVDTPPTRTARHILVASREEADEVFELLQAGADFGDLARERSTDTGSGAAGGVLGPTQRGAFVPPFDDAVWSAALNTVLEPVASEFGFHVIEVIEVVESTTVAAADLDSQARQQLVFEELSEIIEAALQSADVSVDPTVGTWDPIGGRVLPVGRSE